MYHVPMVELRLKDIRRILNDATPESFAAIERSLAADGRKGVHAAVESTRKRIEREVAERVRSEQMYAFERALVEERSDALSVGLDEVGRGPLAGPLTIGAVVLDPANRIDGLNDSKQLSEARREELAAQIKERAVAHTVVNVEPAYIDIHGMTASLRFAFGEAIRRIDGMGVGIGVVLLDGNPLRLDPREVSVVKGDAKCPSIAAASILAKVERDDVMRAYAHRFPQYGFDIHKGYGTQMHRDAIRQNGLTEIHRVSFCSEFTQQSLF